MVVTIVDERGNVDGSGIADGMDRIGNTLDCAGECGGDVLTDSCGI